MNISILCTLYYSRTSQESHTHDLVLFDGLTASAKLTKWDKTWHWSCKARKNSKCRKFYRVLCRARYRKGFFNEKYVILHGLSIYIKAGQGTIMAILMRIVLHCHS